MDIVERLADGVGGLIVLPRLGIPALHTCDIATLVVAIGRKVMILRALNCSISLLDIIVRSGVVALGPSRTSKQIKRDLAIPIVLVRLAPPTGLLAKARCLGVIALVQLEYP